MTQRTGPVEDITIIDCTMAIAGTFGTALLVDLGANVIKFEPPNGDGFHYQHTFSDADYGMLLLAFVNRN